MWRFLKFEVKTSIHRPEIMFNFGHHLEKKFEFLYNNSMLLFYFL